MMCIIIHVYNVHLGRERVTDRPLNRGGVASQYSKYFNTYMA